jgi:patatin-related protein
MATEPTVNCANEVRFAVVMYGGVSLAIYINGVAQELLDMVRATAPLRADENERQPLVASADLKGAMPVYRRLGQYLQNDRSCLRMKPKPADDAPDKKKQEWSTWKNAPIETRFVVDVISGTSAGGINGMFLAKALANNQSMDGLKELWVREGDMGRLLNDEASVADLRQYGMGLAEPRESLLNSQRMYRKLLDALAAMDTEAAPSPSSPLVRELDLFVTTTDIAGLPLPIRLADKLVYERRHRNVFHFRYATPETLPQGAGKSDNDFVTENDPFLAYAARCTSSFPFAFAPMRLCDIDEVTGKYPADHPYRKAAADKAKWDKFFSEYLRHSVAEVRTDMRGRGSGGSSNGSVPHDDAEQTNELREAFAQRSFGDGGYLDNKPFSHATALLMRRGADVPVDRKLVYIEPAPEHPELDPSTRPRPDFLENVLAAMDLPRQETIREDLHRIFERNEVLQRIGSLANNVDHDVAAAPPSPRIGGDAFQTMWLDDLIKIHGVSYGAYHRLKLAEITSMLADKVARAIRSDHRAESGTAIREIIAAWREEHFAPRPGEKRADGTSEKRTENEFLRNFDIRYSLRRLAFTSRRINELYRLNSDGRELLRTALKGVRATLIKNSGEAVARQLPQVEAIVRLAMDDPTWINVFREELTKIKKTKVSNKTLENRRLEESLHEKSYEIETEGGEKATVALPDIIRTLNLNWPELKRKFAEALPDARRQWVQDFVTKPENAAIFARFEAFVRTAFKGAGGEVIHEPADSYSEDPAVVARLVVSHFRENFQLYDMVTFPVLYGTGAGEANMIAVSRISPEDARELEKGRATPRQKLAGTTLMNFGAFLQKAWRRNDILWGRLDGAERLICAVFTPNTDAEETLRSELIVEAQSEILKEELSVADRQTVCRLISDFVATMEPGSAAEEALRELISRDLSDRRVTPGYVETILQSNLKEPKQLWEFYNRGFEVDRRLDAETSVRLIARATDIVGRMLQGLAEANNAEGAARISRRVAVLGRMFWRAVEVAVPRSLPHLFFHHWLAVLYVFDFVFILGGIVFGQPQVKNFGWLLLGVTAGANLIVAALTDYITGRITAFRILRALLAVLLIALLSGGLVFFIGRLTDLGDQQQLIIGSTAAALLGLVAAYAEWRKRLRQLPRAAQEGINWRPMIWLAAITAAFMVTLGVLNPGDVAQVELAGDRHVVEMHFKTAPAMWRAHLLVDLGFLIAYSAFLATACHAAARLWQRRVDDAHAAQQEAAAARAAEKNGAAAVAGAATSAKAAETPSPAVKWFAGAATVSFAVAGLQWIAGLFDVIENWALLSFLEDRYALFNPFIARCAAMIKFPLAIAGCFCAAAGLWLAHAPAERAATENEMQTALRARNKRMARVFAALLLAAGVVFSLAFVNGLWPGEIKAAAIWLISFIL